MRLRSVTKGGLQQTDPISGPSVSSLIRLLPSQPSAPIDPLWTDDDLERLFQRARSSWQKDRLTGNGPPFVRLGRLVRYRPSDVEAWLAALPSLRSTSEMPEPPITPKSSGSIVVGSLAEAAQHGEPNIKPQRRRSSRPRKQAV
jgi:hypothetical protein